MYAHIGLHIQACAYMQKRASMYMQTPKIRTHTNSPNREKVGGHPHPRGRARHGSAHVPGFSGSGCGLGFSEISGSRFKGSVNQVGAIRPFRG